MGATKRKGCVAVVVGTCALIIVAAVASAIRGTDEPSPNLDLTKPVFVKTGAPGCNQLELYQPGLIERCVKFGAQRVEVMQTAHEGRMYQVTPYGLPRDTAEAVAGWVIYSDLHN